MIDYALHYVQLGYRVFPLARGSKVPAIPKERGGRGCLDATTCRDVVERWWQEYPHSNVGIASGRGLLVIDVDPRKSSEWLESLLQLGLPQTFTVRTWSGGWHLYLAFTNDSRVGIGADLLPGIDWRGNGGYVVAAGSIVNDGTYQIAKNLPIAKAPGALLERITGINRVRRIKHDNSGHMVISESNRNDRLMRIGCALRRWGVEYNAILASLRAVNSDHCDPPLDDDELGRIAVSVARYSAAETAKERV